MYGTAFEPDTNKGKAHQVQDQQPGAADAMSTQPTVDTAQFPHSDSSNQYNRSEHPFESLADSVPMQRRAEASPNEYFFGPEDALKYRELRHWVEKPGTCLGRSI